MISVQQAISIIRANRAAMHTEEISVYEAAGRRLAQNLHASRPYPPFRRVTMDGIAVKYQEEIRKWKIEGTQLAGDPPLNLSMAVKDAAVEVMTGCSLPLAGDTVIRYEDLDFRKENLAVIAELKEGKSLIKGSNIHEEGSDAPVGAELLAAGHCIAPCDVALFLSEGFEKIKVLKSASAGLLITGNELSGVSDQPLPWEVRASNHGILVSSLRSSGSDCSVIIAHDEKELLHDALNHLIEAHDLIIITGGVSKGKADYLPEVLRELGAEILFHEVAQRPGKPMLFALSKDKKPIFALPGNPVSASLCHYFYVLPFVKNEAPLLRESVQVKLSQDHEFKPGLDVFLPVKLKNINGELFADPLLGNGSGDFLNLSKADGFLWMQAAQKPFKAGQLFPYLSLR
jgi:molybdopterin molybdotransferase